MQRLIDANAIPNEISWDKIENASFWETINEQPTIEAVPTEFLMENFNLEFVCYALTDDGEWCSERCQYSEPQPECIHRYIDRIWRKEHDQID